MGGKGSLILALILPLLLLGCGGGAAPGQRVIVLGFDGMDHELTEQLMAAGRMPNFTRLARRGSFSPLGTSVPPLSPVAWSNFITGMDAGGHGIFDFMHCDPQTMEPYLATSRLSAAEAIRLGKWQIPRGGEAELLRRGQAFWEVLERHGVETTIIRIPANFPPTGSASREISGMGTPDLLGTYGTFSFYTSDIYASRREVTGGEIYEAWPEDGVVEAALYGPDNPFLVERERVSTDFRVYLDPGEPIAKLVVGDEERILGVGEWTDWVPIEFAFNPLNTVHAMARFYLRQLDPEFELYVTPLNWDPKYQELPISTPDSYAAELAAVTGRFYSQGMPEDTKAYTEGIFSPEDFLVQASIAGGEIIEQYKYVLGEFEEGLLFYYFGNPDLVSHVMWRPRDPDHPAYDPELDAPFAGVIEKVYEQMDEVVGHTLGRIDDQTLLVVMSDHGFTSWRRAFHLNSWLRDHGYLAVSNPHLRQDHGLYSNVDWSRTRAYACGLNGLYVNLRGREREGIVEPDQREALIREIGEKLIETIDPRTGRPAVTRVYPRQSFFKDRGAEDVGPDMVIGYAKMTRGSDESALGAVPPEVIVDNTARWSGDHGMDHETVPGILLTSRPLKKSATKLTNLAASILAEFGIEGFPSRD
ncbi:MAG: hypothetical protein GY856_22380 [bacterium]|nr:hypothetical protein [bacterium]